MNQTQRDLTYRSDALQSVCNEYGFASEECQQATQLWEQQHSMNVWTSKIFTIGFILLIVIVCCFLCFNLYMRMLIKKAKNKEKLKRHKNKKLGKNN